MPLPSPQHLRQRHVPQQNILVPANARKPRIVRRNRDVEHLVRVSGVGLHQSRRTRRRPMRVRGIGRDAVRGCGFGWVVEADESVGGAG
jgi:hypothetical protein